MSLCTKCEKEECNPQRFGKCAERDLMVEYGYCFNCAFWTRISQREGGTQFPIIDGHAFSIGPEYKGSRAHKGMGGRKFVIKFFHQKQPIITTNLWSQGEIPPHFREEIPNNAEFIDNAAICRDDNGMISFRQSD